MTISEQKVHLFVLHHGLWGNKNHLEYITKQLNEAYKDKIHTVSFFVLSVLLPKMSWLTLVDLNLAQCGSQ
jgi:Putative serine esterase (DUF676)